MNVTEFPVEEFNEAQTCYEREWCRVYECLHEFVRQRPGHKESDYVHAKVYLVNRVYRVNLNRRVAEEDFANFLCETGWLDEAIAALNEKYSDFTEKSCPEVVRIHRALVEAGYVRAQAKLVSFCAKYLHFHCAHVVPIYDDYAREKLETYYPSQLIDSEPLYYYQDYCDRFLALYRDAQAASDAGMSLSGEVNVRSLDYFLYYWGQKQKAKARQG